MWPLTANVSGHGDFFLLCVTFFHVGWPLCSRTNSQDLESQHSKSQHQITTFTELSLHRTSTGGPFPDFLFSGTKLPALHLLYFL